ncbi:MAG: hypothetical protein EZS28_047195, partial [Streblomastix strix]
MYLKIERTLRTAGPLITLWTFSGKKVVYASVANNAREFLRSLEFIIMLSYIDPSEYLKPYTATDAR